jgi:TIR domain
VLDLLEEALKSGMLLEQGTGTRITYEFWHPLLVTHLYDNLSAARRASLHRRAANILQQTYKDSEAVTITHHLVEGGADPQTVAYYAEVAGNQIYDRANYLEAAQYYQLALTNRERNSRQATNQQEYEKQYTAPLLRRIEECRSFQRFNEEDDRVYLHTLRINELNASKEYYTCFISFSNQDQAFVEQLYADLQLKGVHCWYAPKDLKTGDFFWDRIDESIRSYDKLLLVLSQHSVESSWVRREVAAALEKEDQQKQSVLFPIRLDNIIMTTDKVWAADIRRQRHIGDFEHWTDTEKYQVSFQRLLRARRGKQEQGKS